MATFTAGYVPYRFHHHGEDVADVRVPLPQVEAARTAYKALGKDPARYRGSAEALLRRVVGGKGLPQINAVVDVINLVSVESRLPVGLYDLGHVVGEIVFRAGRTGETYKGIQEPLISTGLFKQVQTRLQRRVWTRKWIHDFTLRVRRPHTST